MSEQEDVIGGLEQVGALAGVRWAYRSAARRSLEDYSEADGHDAALLGQLRHTLYRNRLDRVFACGRYELRPDSNGEEHLDVLYAELTSADIRAMPRLAPDLVRRSDLCGSPGWAFGKSRFLLAACGFGRIDSLPWPRRSTTKQRVARQLAPDPAQPSLFDGVDDEAVVGLEQMFAAARKLDLETYVVAHTLDPYTREMELVLGRARLNVGGGPAWHWYQDLLTVPPAGSRGGRFGSPPPPAPQEVPDVPVRLRRGQRQQTGGQVSGA